MKNNQPSHITEELILLKGEIVKVCRFELDAKHYNACRAEKIVDIFQKKISRNYYFKMNVNISDPHNDTVKKRKILNVIHILESCDWSDHKILALVESVLGKIFTSTDALNTFSRNIKKIKTYSKGLYITKNNETIA